MTKGNLFFTILTITIISAFTVCKEENKNNSEKDDEYYNSFFEGFTSEFQSNPYSELKISPWSTFNEIKASYKKLVLLYHPDKSGRNTTEKFMNIQKAYEVIKKSRKINNEEDLNESKLSNFLNMTASKIVHVFVIYVILFLLKYLFQLFSRFFDFIWVKIILYYISWLIIDGFLPHLIDDVGNKMVYSIILMLFLNYSKNKFL